MSSPPAHSGESRRQGLALPALEITTHALVALLFLMVLGSAGQPIISDDLWWHLGSGARYADEGPWLQADPFLYLAEQSPAPAAWLFGVALDGAVGAFGFQGLRVFHVLIVFLIGSLAWFLMYRVSGSRVAASLGSAAFLCLAAFRLFQLRPHLASLLATLLVLGLLVLDRRGPSFTRIALSAVVFAVWANLHGAFLMGLGLVAAAAVGAVVAIGFGERGSEENRVRCRRLWGALLVGALATTFNPMGWRGLTPFFVAGAETPDLKVVGDEWAAVDLFSIPVSNLPPTPEVWTLLWLLVLALIGLTATLAFSRDRWERLDWPLCAVGWASALGMLSAVRLNWLGFIVALAIVHMGRIWASGKARTVPSLTVCRAMSLLTALVLLGSFWRWGDWLMISPGLTAERYPLAYSIDKYHGHGVWFLRDTGVRGNVFADYWLGNFLGYWLSPEVKLFVNGSLNVPAAVMDDGLAIRSGGPDENGRLPGEILGAHDVDFFFGTGLPMLGPPGRPPPDTTRHLMGDEDWILVFRNRRTAIRMHLNAGNLDNLDRIRRYYAEQGVSFDPESGFDPFEVIRQAPQWAEAHGLIPSGFQGAQRRAHYGPLQGRQFARSQVADVYAALGLYGRALALESENPADAALSLPEARRRVWLRLMEGRGAEATDESRRLAAIASETDWLSVQILKAANNFERASGAERAEIQAMLPLWTRPQGFRVMGGFREAPLRPPRS
ncbi:MAG: hypothetical protein CBC48_15955 [bacterium TMED88]|nr:hypothetical protein [Deltaproteobacteria bacterium]OUV25877.1 MAG: hypothetical protein CBC48_15955 [bacterium TMED88]